MQYAYQAMFYPLQSTLMGLLPNHALVVLLEITKIVKAAVPLWRVSQDG
jgi:hypothetical protein